MELKGTGGEIGLDGKLRVKLGAVDVKVVGELTHRGGAHVVTNRNEPVGRVEAVVGTVQRPIAIVRLHPEAKALADRLQGKELFIG
jgi:rRNA processing protein Gar1